MKRNDFCVRLLVAQLFAATVCFLLLSQSSSSASDESVSVAEKSPHHWFTSYSAAVSEALSRRCMLLVWFQNPAHAETNAGFDARVLNDPAIRDLVAKTVAVRLPLDAKVQVGGKPVTLLEHPAFAEMLGGSGLAMLDMTDSAGSQHRRVTSVYPFTGQYISKSHLAVLLTLPPGTLTQRTMIFAVRTHPEQPASASSELSSLLLTEAASHSAHQASILLQGHHNWDSRFHSINARLPPGHVATEVCAESWPGETLVQAAQECVHSWRQSPGHWSAVRERHALFGYDIKRGTNGIWYATGIFGRRM